MDVMLVDDDKLIRDDIRAFFQWEKEGFAIVNESVNGDEALRWLATHTADLILTDISMPRMNGIDMIQALKERGFAGEIIVMSNYDDFDYVRDAMRLGAFDYCLKYKMSPQSLLALLKKAADALQSRRERSATSASRTRGELLEDALLGRVNALDAGVRAGLIAPAYSLLYLEGVERPSVPEQEARALAGLGVGILRMAGEGVVLAAPFEARAVSKESPLLAQALQTARRLAPGRKIVVAPERTEPRRFCARMEEMRNSAKRYFYQEREVIYNDPFLVWTEALAPARKRQLEAELYRAAETLNRERFDRAEADALQAFVDCNAQPRSVCAFFENILSRICQAFDVSERDVTFSTASVACLSALRTALAAWKRGFFLVPVTTAKEEIVNAIHFIYANYARELSLDDVAQAVFLSRNHFCTLFRKEVGENFVSFLQKLRVEKAKLFLADNRYQVQEIAAAVGFDNGRYFSMVFHKYTGMSPTQYRERAL